MELVSYPDGKAYEKTPNGIEAYFKRYGIQGLTRLRDEQKIDFKNKIWTKEKCIKFFKDYLQWFIYSKDPMASVKQL